MKRSEAIDVLYQLIIENVETFNSNIISCEFAEIIMNKIESIGMMPPLTTVEFKSENGQAELFTANSWDSE